MILLRYIEMNSSTGRAVNIVFTICADGLAVGHPLDSVTGCSAGARYTLPPSPPEPRVDVDQRRPELEDLCLDAAETVEGRLGILTPTTPPDKE